MPSADYVREIFRSELGYEPDAKAIQWYTTRGLDGDALIKAILTDAKRDPTVYNDASYSAFARANRQRRSQAMLELTQRQSELGNQRALASRGFDELQRQRVQDVKRDYEGRGMLRAGRRVIDQKDAVQGVTLQRQQSELNFSDKGAELRRQHAQEIADLSRQNDEQRIAARNRLTDASIQQAARNRI